VVAETGSTVTVESNLWVRVGNIGAWDPDDSSEVTQLLEMRGINGNE
jgi:hypothetical protein